MLVAGFGLLPVLPALAAVSLSPETEMAFTLKDVVTYCSLVAGLGMTWANLQGKVNELKRDAADASRAADEAAAKADAIHRRFDALVDGQGGLRLEIARLQGEVKAYSDGRFTALQSSVTGLHQSLAQAGLTNRRGGEPAP